MKRFIATLLSAAILISVWQPAAAAVSGRDRAPGRATVVGSIHTQSALVPGADLRPVPLIENSSELGDESLKEIDLSETVPSTPERLRRVPVERLSHAADDPSSVPRESALELVRHPERVELPLASLQSGAPGESATQARRQMDLIVGAHSVESGGELGLPRAAEPGGLGPRSAWKLAASPRGPPSVQPASRLQVLPDRQRDRELKKYFGIMSLFLAGFNAFYTALPGLFGGAGSLGISRAAGYAGQAFGNFTTGPVLSRITPRKLLSATWIGRSPAIFLVAALSLAVPYGYLGFGTFFASSLGLLAVEGLLQSWSITAGNVVYNDIVGNDEAHFNRATAVYDILSNAVGAAASLGASYLIKTINAAFGIPHAGEAVAVALFAATLVGAGVWSMFLKYSGRSASQQAAATTGPKKSLGAQLREGWSLILKDRFLWVTLFFCTIEYLTASAFFYPMLSRYMNEVLAAAGSSGFFGKDGLFGLYLAASYIGPLIACVGMIYWRDRPTSKLEQRLSGLKENLLARGDDPQAASAVVEAARDAARQALGDYRAELARDASAIWTAARYRQAFDSHVPTAVRPALSAAGFDAELDAWLAEQLGAALKEARREAKTGHDFLERQWKWTTILFGAGSLCYIGVFWSPIAAGSLGFMLLSALLQAPAGVVGQSLTQRVLLRRYRDQMGEVYAAQFLYANLLVIAGLFLFVYLMKVLSMPWLLATVAGVQIAGAALRFLMSRFALPKGT